MARWLAFRGSAVVGRLDAPDQATALARARQYYGASRVQSVASYEVSVLERQPKRSGILAALEGLAEGLRE